MLYHICQRFDVLVETIQADSLSLFQAPEVHTGSQKTEWLTFTPINQLTEGAAIEFNVPGTSTSYINLEKVLLCVKFNVVRGNGSILESTDPTGVINNILHTMFSQVDVNADR